MEKVCKYYEIDVFEDPYRVTIDTVLQNYYY